MKFYIHLHASNNACFVPTYVTVKNSDINHNTLKPYLHELLAMRKTKVKKLTKRAYTLTFLHT